MWVHTAPRYRWLHEQGSLFEDPARMIGRSRYSVRGRVSTEKSPESQDSECLLEYDFLLLLEHDQRVRRFAVQPITLRWEDESGRRCRYTPDVVVEYSEVAMVRDPCLRLTLYEVKPRDLLKRDWQELKPKFRAATAWAREMDYRFRIVTEKEIRTPYLDNVNFLRMFSGKRMIRNQGLTAEIQWRIRDTLFDLKRTTPRELLNTITPDPRRQAEHIPWIWHLINEGFVGCDLSKPLTMISEIWSLETAQQLGRKQ